jgi:hypothetical protein
MNYATQNELVSKMGNWIASRLDKYEAILFLFFIVTFLLKLSTSIPVNILVVLTLMTLSSIYFFSAFASINDEYAGGLESFLHKLASWACSIVVIGIMFRLQKWFGYKNMILIGCCTLIIVLTIILYNNSKKPELKLFGSRYILRIIIICLIGFFLAFASHEVLVKNKIIENTSFEKTK